MAESNEEIASKAQDFLDRNTTAEISSQGAGESSPDVKEIVAQIGAELGKDKGAEEAQKLEFAASAAMSIAFFGFALAAMVGWLGYKNIIQPSKLIALILIVTAALLLIVLGYTDEQMSPVVGLLGTVAGYMLGSKEWDRDQPANPPADQIGGTESAADPGGGKI